MKKRIEIAIIVAFTVIMILATGIGFATIIDTIPDLIIQGMLGTCLIIVMATGISYTFIVAGEEWDENELYIKEQNALPKVYCGRCRFIQVDETCNCYATMKIKDTYYSQFRTPQLCAKLNKDNHCPYFEE